MNVSVDHSRRIKRPTTQLTLAPEDREELAMMMRRGRSSARIFKRARVLQLLDQGVSPGMVRLAVGVSYTLVQRIASRYRDGGLHMALHEAPRPGVARRLDPEQESKVLALVCSPPPVGNTRWSVRLLTQQVVEHGIAIRVGRETIRELLKRHHIQPWKAPLRSQALGWQMDSTAHEPSDRTQSSSSSVDAGRVGVRWLAR